MFHVDRQTRLTLASFSFMIEMMKRRKGGRGSPWLTMEKRRWIGFVYILLGASFWGIGGTVAQYLFQYENVSVEWLVSFRLVVSGILLLIIAQIQNRKTNVFRIFLNKHDTIQLLIFSLFGMLAVQYTYMESIHLGNAAVATLLQYLSPIYIILFLILKRTSSLKGRDIIAVLLAFTGTLLLLTNGEFNRLSVPTTAVLWGMLSGVTLAFYTLYPKQLLQKWGSTTVVAWGMFIGGVILSIFHPPWQVHLSDWTLVTGFCLFFVVIFGTMLAFWFYLESLAYLKPQETSVLGTVEPLTAIIASVLWLQIPFGSYQMIGTCFILMMVFVLSLSKN